MRNSEAIVWQKLIENGYAARTIPKEYGGFGAKPDIIKSRIIAEEFSREQINPGLGGQGISMLVPVLLEMGTEEQKRSSSNQPFMAKWSGAKATLNRELVATWPP